MQIGIKYLALCISTENWNRTKRGSRSINVALQTYLDDFFKKQIQKM